MNGITVIVLTWNGIDLIKECLPIVYAEVNSWLIAHEIILVDNGSNDNTVEYVRNEFSDVRIVAFDENLGFARANNLAVKEAKFDKLLFLNNDLVLDKDFIYPMLKRLEYEDVFAVAPKILRWDRKTIDDGLRYGEYFSGLFSVQLQTDKQKVDLAHVVTFFCGACFLCKKSFFIQLNGFDELYTPYAWEDLDLGYRCWKRGLKVVYEPRSVSFHKREATTRSLFSNFFFITLMWRNKFIFMWKNLTDRDLLKNHLVLLPWKLIKFTFNGRWRYVIGFFRALFVLPMIINKRRFEKKFIKLSDADVLRTSFKPIHKDYV